MEYYCEKKDKCMTKKRALKKCVKINIEKRGTACQHLNIRMKFTEYEREVRNELQ